jgi:hypothetical protein
MTTIDPGYYVTVRDAGRVGFLAGPYETQAEAVSRVDAAAERAMEADAWAHFYAFGTSRVKTPISLRRGGVAFGMMDDDTAEEDRHVEAPTTLKTASKKIHRNVGNS